MVSILLLPGLWLPAVKEESKEMGVSRASPRCLPACASLHLIPWRGRDSYAHFTHGETEAGGRSGGEDLRTQLFLGLPRACTKAENTVLLKEGPLVESMSEHQAP